MLSVDEPTSSMAPTTTCTCTTSMPSNRSPARIRHHVRTGTTAGSSRHACAVLLLFLLLAMMAPSCIVAAADLDHTSRSASSHGSPHVRLLSVTTSRRDYSSHHHHLRGAEEEEIRLRGSSRTKPLQTHSAIVTTTAIADHSSSAEREDNRSLKQAASSSSSSCQLGLDAVLSYDAANANIRADTTIANLCQADARLTELTMSSCVKCDEVLLNAQVEEEYDDGEGGTGDGDRRERQEYSECSSPVSILQNFVDLNGGSDVLLEDNTGNAATSNNMFAFAADLTSFGGGPKVACSNRYYAVFSYEAEAVLREEDAQDLQKELNDKLEQVEYDVGVAKELADEGGGNIAASNNDDNNLVTGQSINTSAKNKKNTTTNNKDKKPKRRFCPARLERSVCQRCQNLVKKQFEQKKCSNDLAAAREGKDCNRYFDRCRLAKFRRSCRKWRDPYANCFLPLAVSPNPDAQTCEKSCKVTLNGESTYNADSQTVQMEVTIFNNCPSVIALEKLEYSLCTECTSPDDTVEKICRDKEDILEVLRKVNGGYATMPPDALRYLVLETDKVVLEGSCLVYAKLNYEAIAAIQVFHEVFQASVEVECTDDEDPDVTATSGGVPRPIQPSESLNEAFQSYFQAEEECLYADLDGCGGRDVVYAEVDAVEESACVEVIHSPQGGVVDPNRQRKLQGKPKKKNRRKVLKIRGRNRKNGQCRRKCASRNKKVRDDISAPILAAARDEEGLESEPDMRFLLSLNPPRAKCVSSDVSKPDLQKELEQRSDDIGFLPRRAAVTEVKELKCSTDSEACQDGTHKCCGTEGCSCGEQDITNENCQAGTRLADENIMECFLSLTGNVDAPNACCATSGCAGSDVC